MGKFSDGEDNSVDQSKLFGAVQERITMDRITWLKEMRRECEEQYDTRWAPFYGEKWGLYPNKTHRKFIQEFLRLIPQHSLILDAACGAGRYLPDLLKQGHSILGIDQSQGMLSQAKSKFPSVPFEKVGLQEMAYQEEFDGAICMDAMENVPPEDWPQVLSNFRQALKQPGWFYFTTETIETSEDEKAIRQAFQKAQAAGLPVVYGEWPEEEVYHFHPTNQQVKEWTQEAGFEILKEGEGEDYFHLLVRKGAQVQQK
jgi:cyclopropane fatty-acyl-phospholipid synthase-like methyltransferase